jgi:phage terminase small subunit
MQPRERRFVREYLRLGNGEAAALAAGCQPSRAWYKGLRLLAKAEVRAAILRGRERRGETVGVTAERVLLEYARIAFADVARALARGADNLPAFMHSADDAAAVSAVFFTRGSTRPSVRFHAKPFALEALGRYFNIFDAEAWRDTSAGARDRLLARLEAMAAAEDARWAAEAESEGPSDTSSGLSQVGDTLR